MARGPQADRRAFDGGEAGACGAGFFGQWLGEHHPGIKIFADVTRQHCLDWIGHIAEAPAPTTGKPLGVMSRIQRISGLSQFFRDTALWQYDDVPGHTLIGAGDAPKYPQKVPRFIPEQDLDRLVPAIDAIACPFQRAALLVARWSGARRTEIHRLPLDCLDRYPDGTARLRLSGRKTYKERVVPLHEDAAEALQKVIDLRRPAPERPFTDERIGEEIRYLFMSHGKLLSTYYLFETPIQAACKAVGLVRPGGGGGTGRGTVSAHRFRHTVGTQLAERGAKLHTIMKVLGHTSVNMALVYAQISDQEVLRDYQAVLGPGATIAGLAADELRSGTLPDASVDWLKTNFFKTELELGRCLRLPAEGPCECDLYLREVRHHTRIRTTTARTARSRADPRPRRGRTRLGPRGRTPPLHQRTYRKTPGRPQPADQRGRGGGRLQCMITPWRSYRSGPCSSTWTVGSDKNTSASTGP
ncbi:site-specific integrase [Streptomyces sp. NK08204]|uniref:tyrosine-type recombinase/integrase n=1 Tax=Streptomyces sp. NK08204 TaxID=2873260 RepID=UPI001CED6F54|nr:site-specific integrase [Streptomyces sp. NK08204]